QAMTLGNDLPYSPAFDALKQAAPIQRAMSGAEEALQTRAIAGGAASPPPVSQNSLAYWDQVKRNLDKEIFAARGNREALGELVPLKQRLVETLDAMVPAYKNARGVWGAFAGADNAVEAGQNFINSKMTSAQAERLMASMTPEQQELFRGAARTAFLSRME